MTKEKTVTMTKYWLGKPSEVQVTRNEYIKLGQLLYRIEVMIE